MDIEQDPKPQPTFVQRRLPWFIAGGALLFYLFTVRHWITFLGLAPLARVSGWDWHPVLHAPLTFVLTLPFRWLPPSLQMIGLNLFAAVCGALTLALLARSVALLPHDRTRDQRQAQRGESFLNIPTAWLPPLLAALVCGLQMTFWEHTVVWTGEALDLLLFAYVVRCLLEFRADRRDSWLARLALVCGLGVTNNFAMIAFLPAVGIAVFWVKGLGIFNYRLCLRLALCALAGLSLYLLIPIMHIASGLQDVSFWELLRLNLGFQKNAIFSFRRVIILMLSLTSLVPVLFIGIKWPASFGDISAAGNAMTNLMTHVIHGVFLLACLYVAFDPAYSPRTLGSPYPFLPFYYLGALSVGYFSGYFLLVFARGQLKAWQRPSILRKGLNTGIVALVWAAAVAVPVGLIYRNLPELKANLGPTLSQYAGLLAKSLPPQEAVVLSDEPLMLFGVSAVLAQSGAGQNKVLVETPSLRAPYYHSYLARRHPLRWPALARAKTSSTAVDSSTLVRLVTQLSASNTLYYLQPSFGFYFERLYLKPRNLVYELKPYPTNTLAKPPLSAEEIQENERFWQQMKNEDLKPVLQSIKAGKKSKLAGYAPLVGMHCARNLDYLGVELQRGGDLQRASNCFAMALEFNPESPCATINLAYNKSLQTEHPEPLKRSEEIEKLLAPFHGNWDMLLGWSGPIDEPFMLDQLAVALASGKNYRQAGEQMLRLASLSPTNTDARVGLADMSLKSGFVDLALKYVAEARAMPTKLHTADREALMQIEAWAYTSRNEFPIAEKLLQKNQVEYPLNDLAYSTLAEIYLRQGRITNAMEVLEKELKALPENSSVLNNYARLKILNKEFDPAIKLLDHALTLEPKNNLMLFNRALCNLNSGKLDDAQRDYQTLETSLPKIPYPVYFGLFDVAYKKKNPKTAIRYGELYLKTAPKGSAESNDVQERIKKVKSGAF